MKQPKKYTGSAYIAVVGSENENGECRDTIEAITRQGRDSGPHYVRATKGYEARQLHLNNWYEGTKHPFMLLLDHDMKFPPYTLARLRAHGLPFVSGLYMRRRYNPIAPVWFDYGEPGQMPMIPFTAVPLDNTLYKIGASGWGCILIHRDVITATRKILKGEPEIIEDDMDLYPYDLAKLIKAANILQSETLTIEEARKAVETVRGELRPLRGVKDTVGSDIRFPFFARLAGFEMIGDSGVMCEHMLNYPLNPRDYTQQSAANVRDVTISIRNDVMKERQRIEKAVAGI
jgi:hypothetical protein